MSDLLFRLIESAVLRPIRLYALMFLLAVGSLAAQPVAADHLLPRHQLNCSADFPCPDEIRRRVDFWIQVFKGWDKEKAILHDPNRPERVYMVIDTGHGCGRAARTRIKKNRKVVSTALEALATNIAKGRNITNERQQHLLTLFPARKPSEIRKAAKSIRCQSGVQDSFIDGLKRFNRYSAMVDRILAENNLPPDIRYLPFVESSYNPAAYSKAGAAGLWQIMPATARSLGLELNATVDERLDPEAATRAAAKYLTKATSSLGRLSREKNPKVSQSEINPFVITSYNYGVNGMRRAIRKLNPDFMRVLNNYKSPSFQVAVKNFYASFLAARHVALNADQYFGNVVAKDAQQYDALVLQHPTSINRIQKVFGVSQKALKPLNGPLTRFIWNGWRLIPAGYQVRLPKRKDNWKDARARLAAMAPEKEVPGGGSYVVRRGDTACGIARALRVNCNTLIKANGLSRKAVIRIGQKLIIPRVVVADSSPGSTPEKIDAVARPETYKVRRGDSACVIAKRLGVSCRELISVNKLGRKARIRIGQELIVPRDDFVPGTPAGLNAENRYVVKKGDIACRIAARFDVSCRELVKLNTLGKKARIYPGQKLVIPGYEGEKTSETALELAEAPKSQKPLGKTTPDINQPAAAQPDNKLINLLDTLPDLSIRVGNRDGNPVYYIYVEVDETLGHYADWLGIGGSSTLRKLNKLKSTSNLRLGMRLVFPRITAETVARFEQRRTEYHQVLSESLKEKYQLVGIEQHTVRQGESLWFMSQRLGFPLWLLYRLNPSLRVSGLSVGEQINLPQLKEI